MLYNSNTSPLSKRREQLEQIEKLIDNITISQMVEMMSEICYEKAAHLRENWQDEKTAKIWDKNARQLSNISGKLYS